MLSRQLVGTRESEREPEAGVFDADRDRVVLRGIDLAGQPADTDRHGVNARHENDLVAGGHAFEIDAGFQTVADRERVVHDKVFGQLFRTEAYVVCADDGRL